MLHPPACLQHVNAAQAPEPEILLDTLTESPNRFFSLSCPCGETRFLVSGEMHRNVLIDRDLIYGPVTAKCATCQRASLLFDPRVHGYDVEIDHFPPTWQATSQARDFECPSCTGAVFALTARFEYPAALLQALELGQDPGYPGYVGREHDLFTWFTLVGQCSTCHTLETIASVECA
jgi:hypothetical protein